MKINLLAGVLGAALILSPLSRAQQRQDGQTKVTRTQADPDGLQEAIAFQRAKERADARQARLDQRHPSVNYSNAARTMDDSSNHVSDPGPTPVKKDRN
jgi:hypothetical protein